MTRFGNKSDIYQYAIDQASIVSITDGDGNITYVNDNFCKISGYSKEELLGQNHRLVNSNHHSKEFFKLMWSQLKDGIKWSGEICNRAKDGSLYWVKTTITPIRDQNGEINEMISIREDITSMKNMESLFAEKSKTLGFVLDSEHTGIFQYIFDEDKLKYEDNLLTLLGIEESVLGQSLDNLLNLFPKKDRVILGKRIRSHVDLNNEYFEYMTNYRLSKNDIRKIRIYGKIVSRDRNGNPSVLVGLVKDLTEQYKLEGLLLRTQKVAKIGSWEIDVESGSMIWSPSTYMIYGYEPYSFTPTVDWYYEQNVDPDYHEQLRSLHEKAIQDGEKSYQIELPVFKANGKRIWVRHIIHTEKVANEVYKIYGTTQDINDQKVLELDLQKSMKKVDMALETAGFGIGEINYSKRSINIDDYLKNLLGLDYLSREVTYKDVKRAMIVEDFYEVNRLYAEAIAKKETVVNAQFRVVKDNGAICFIQSRGIIDYASDGRVITLLGLFWDITQDKEFENILIETKNKAEQATSMKSSFLASMSHEIRTPMNGVLGMLELLQDTNLSDEQKKLVETMRVCGNNLVTVVNDVLDLSKIEAGKLTFEKRKFDLRTKVTQAFNLFKANADKKGVEFNLHIDEKLPRYVETDEVRLNQVISNLLSNALKFTEEGSVDLMVYFGQPSLGDTKLEYGEGTINFIIRDTGIGISEDQIDKLFVSFTQIDASITRRFGGTGLGLAISKSLVERMGGEIKVKSVVGKGTTFKFNILCAYSNTLEEERVSIAEYHYRRDIRVLVAEDNPINQNLVRAFMNKLGLKIDIADNGLMAFNMATDHEYDIIFMDLQMPEMDGIKATEKILKSRSIEKKPVIVAMTANVFEEDRNRCFSVGMSDFIPKPFSNKLLLSILSRYFPDYGSEKISGEQRMEKESSKYKLINESQILFEFEDDFDIFEELFDDYRSRASTMVHEIKEAYEKGSAHDVKVGAHTLKGVVANFYSDELTDAAFQMELAARNEDLSDLPTLLSHFINYNDGVLAELSSFIQEVNAKKSSEAA